MGARDGPGGRVSGRNLPWLAGALAAVAAGVLGVVAPWSWWGAVFAAAVVFALVAARPVMNRAYAGGWPRTTVILGLFLARSRWAWRTPRRCRRGGSEPGVYVAIALGLALFALITFGGNVTTLRTKGADETFHETQAHLRRAAGRRW